MVNVNTLIPFWFFSFITSSVLLFLFANVFLRWVFETPSFEKVCLEVYRSACRIEKTGLILHRSQLNLRDKTPNHRDRILDQRPAHPHLVARRTVDECQ